MKKQHDHSDFYKEEVLQDIWSHCQPRDCINKIKSTLDQKTTSWQEVAIENKRESGKRVRKAREVVRQSFGLEWQKRSFICLFIYLDSG